MVSIIFSLCSFIFMTFVVMFYFTKNRINNLENKIYSYLLIANFLGLFIDIIGFGLLKMYEPTALVNLVVSHLYLLYYFSWGYLLTLYVYSISFDQKNNTLNHKTGISIFYIIVTILVIILPVHINVSDNAAYSYGVGVNLVYILSGIFIAFNLFCVFKKFKKIRLKKYTPIFMLLFLTITAMAIQKCNPEITLLVTCQSVVTFIMYFTIENPDAQLIGELYKNKKIIEKSNEDISRFLFRMTQDIRKPIKDIITLSRDMSTMKNKDQLISASKNINLYSNQIDFLINKALNISDMDTQKIKVFDNRYNVSNLFKSIAVRAKEEIPDNVKFEFNIASNLPMYLYGDSIKLKQAISSVISIASSFTKEGFISLDISSMIRYNICRLVIMIEDSGRGIGIDRINEILSFSNEELENIKVDKEENEKLNIIEVKKIIQMLGGNFMLKSEEGVGTTVTIVLEQRIVETKDAEITKTLENYEQSLQSEKKVLVVDDDEKELAEIEKMLTKQDFAVSSTVYAKDCVEKIRSNLKYDLIILDDDIGENSALEVLQNLQKIKNFKTPVVVMLNENKQGIILHYLQDGFAECIKKEKLESEINRIIKLF